MNKFVVVGHARCGSTVLTTSLNHHNNIHMFGEVFNDNLIDRHHAYRKGIIKCNDAPKLNVTENNYYHSGDAGEFLKRFVYYERNSTPLAVGFKIFYSTCRNDSDSMKAWKYLVADKEIQVIHIYRRNLLDSFLSLHTAYKTGQWFLPISREGDPRERKTEMMYLRPEACEGYFNHTTQLRELVLKDFRKHPIIELTYEDDIYQSFQKTFDRVCHFIGVTTTKAIVTLEKQATSKTSDRITNYEELQKYFSKTKYASHFE